MGDVQAPGGYFVGRPEKYEEKPKDAADQPASTQQGTPGDYFVGRPQQQQAQPTPAAPPSADQRRPGFFAKLFPCLAGGGAAS